jgi:hypothetical protein
MTDARYSFPHENTPALNDFYGNPSGYGGRASPTWAKKNLVSWTPPYKIYYSGNLRLMKTLTIHRLVVPAYDLAFKNALKHFGEEGLAKNRLNMCGGTYNYRVMRGGSRLSTHAYGIAIDIDPENNPFPHPWNSNHGINMDFVNILQEAGLWWRGYQGDVDPMHFQAAYRGQKLAAKPVPVVAEAQPHPAVAEVKPLTVGEAKPLVNLKVDENTAPGKIYTFFLNNQFTPEQAAGVVANVEAESGFDIDNVGDGGRARGLFQMHPDRRSVIWDAVKCNMKSGDIEEQCRGALWELQHVELRAYRMIKAAETAYEAGYNFCRYYERPASHMEWVRRGRKAVKWFEQFNSTSDGNSASAHDLKWVQVELNKLYPDLNLVEDGDFGPRTRSAVKKFQTDKGLDLIDGLPGTETKTALEKALT